MDLINYVGENRTFFLILLSWALVGFLTPSVVAISWALLSFMLIVRANNLSHIFLAFLAMLILSDSRVNMMAFAQTAKIGAVLIMLAYIITNYKDFRSLDNRVFLNFLPFLLFAVAASAWSDAPFTAFQKSISYSFIFFIVPLFYNRVKLENVKIGRDLIYFITIVLFLGIVGFYINFDFGTLAGRFRGLLGNPNGLGILLTVVGPIYYLLKKQGGGLDMDLRTEIFFIAVFVYSLLQSGSRTTLFALLIFISFSRLRYFSNAISLIIFLFILIGYDMIFSSLPIIAQALGLQEYLRIETLDEGSGRFIAWNFAWQQIQDVFFVGGGFGNAELTYKRFFWELSALGHQGNAHNSYLTLWLDTGLIGIGLFLIGLVRSTLASLRYSPYTLPLIFTVGFSANFESWLAASLNPFTTLFLIALTITMSHSEKDDTASVDQETLPT